MCFLEPLGLDNVGAGFTPSASYFVPYTGVILTSVTGSGLNAAANIAIDNGVHSATISAGGEGYAVGDVLTPITIGNDNLGSGMRLSVGTISGNNQLLLDGVQGNFNTIGGNDLEYVNRRNNHSTQWWRCCPVEPNHRSL